MAEVVVGRHRKKNELLKNCGQLLGRLSFALRGLCCAQLLGETMSMS